MMNYFDHYLTHSSEADRDLALDLTPLGDAAATPDTTPDTTPNTTPNTTPDQTPATTPLTKAEPAGQLPDRSKMAGLHDAGDPRLGPAPTSPFSAPEQTPAQRRVSLQLSASLHRQVKLVALEEEETLNSLIVRLLRRYIQERDKAIQAERALRRRLGRRNG